MLWLTLAFSLSQSMKEGADWAIAHGGLVGATGLMALESMIAPVPSEAVMPPLGFLIYKTQQGILAPGDPAIGWTGAILATTLGSLIGSLISYYLGYFGGKPLVMKVGRWLFINEHHLDLTHDWFTKHGSGTVFICRFVPVIRHFISIPAGIARMNLLKFCVFTAIGATMWNTFLLWVGFHLQANWKTIEEYRHPVDIVMVILCTLAIALWFALHLKSKPKTPTTPSEPQA